MKKAPFKLSTLSRNNEQSSGFGLNRKRNQSKQQNCLEGWRQGELLNPVQLAMWRVAAVQVWPRQIGENENGGDLNVWSGTDDAARLAREHVS